jgi:hypothetical protein
MAGFSDSERLNPGYVRVRVSVNTDPVIPGWFHRPGPRCHYGLTGHMHPPTELGFSVADNPGSDVEALLSARTPFRSGALG